MKKSTTRRLLVIALALCLISTSLIGGTLARYTSAVSGSATVNIADWDIDFTNSNENAVTNNFSFNLNSGNPIVPGDKGTFTIKVTNNSEIQAKIETLEITGTTTNFTCTASANTGDILAAKDDSGDTDEKVITFTWEYKNLDDNQTVENVSSIGITIKVVQGHADETNITDVVPTAATGE